jgi:cell division septum initiation protein DivIVA
MTNSDHRVLSHYQSPSAIRDETFQRKMLGVDADQVYEYLDLLSDQVQATERELDEARTENARLQAEVQRMQGELDEHERASERVNDQMVQLFSQAQLIAEEMVQDVSRDARERIGQAREHERKIVEEAVNAAGQQVRTYARTAQAQMQAIMESFASEVDRLGDPSVARDPAPVPPQPRDPLFGEFTDWQVQVRNGHGTNGHGTNGNGTNGNGNGPGSHGSD